eukprot:g588.t1
MSTIDNANHATRECRKCPPVGPDEEATCGNGVLKLRNGFWSSAAPKEGGVLIGAETQVGVDTVFTKCPCPECCIVNSYTGNLTCREGTSGILCAVCQKEPVRYHRTLDDRCVECPDVDLGAYLKSQYVQFITLGLLTLLIAALMAMDSRTEWKWWGRIRAVQKKFQGLQARFYAKGKVMFSFGQIATLFKDVYDTPLPPSFIQFAQYLAFFNIDFFRWIPLDCWVDFDFHDGLLLSTLLFLSLPVVALGCTRVIAWANRTNTENIAWIGRRASSLIGFLFFVAFAVYPSLSTKIFKTFNCGTVMHAGGNMTSYLKADYSIDCLSQKHQSWQAYAWVMVWVISFGTPLLYWALLRHSKAALLRGDRSADYLLFLCQDYNNRYYNWEVVETVRKLLLTGVAVFIEQGTFLQVVVAMVETAVFLGLLVACKPYRNPRDYRYAAWLNALLLLYIFILLLLKFDKHLMQMQNAIAPGTDFALDKQGYATDMLAWCLIVVVTTVLLLFFAFMWWDLKCLQTEEIMRYTEDKSLVWPLSEEQLLRRRMRHKTTVVCVLTRAFFTQKRCVAELRWAWESFTAYHALKSHEERQHHQGTRALLLIVDHEVVEMDELIRDATTQDDKMRRARDEQHHNSNLVTDFRDYIEDVSTPRPRTEGKELHGWLKLHLSQLLRTAAKPRTGNTGTTPIMIPWFGDNNRMGVTLKRIVQESLYVSFDGEHVYDGALPELYVPGETGLRALQLPPAVRVILRRTRGHKRMIDKPKPVTVLHHLFLSPHHHATLVLREKLTESAGTQLKCSTDEKVTCTHMLVVLDAGGSADAENSSPALRDERYRADIIQAANLGLRLIVMHVTDAPFHLLVDEKLMAAGIRSPADAVPCPVSVFMPRAAAARWRSEHPDGALPPGVAFEDAELERIALKRVGERLTRGVKLAAASRGQYVRRQVQAAARELSFLYFFSFSIELKSLK